MKLSEIIKRAKFVKHGSNITLELNLSNIESGDEIDNLTNYFESMVKKMPQKSFSCLINMTGLNANENNIKTLEHIYKNCIPLFKGSVVVSDDYTFKSMIEDLVVDLNLDKTPVFTDCSVAKQYLLNN